MNVIKIKREKRGLYIRKKIKGSTQINYIYNLHTHVLMFLYKIIAMNVEKYYLYLHKCG